MPNPAGTVQNDAQAIDEALLAIVHDDPKALSKLLTRMTPALRQRLSVPEAHRSVLDVDDVIQVTYIEVFRQIRRFCSKKPDAFLAWLVRLAQNNMRDGIKGLRRTKRGGGRKHVVAGADDSYHLLLADLAGSGTTPSQGAALNETKSLIENTLTKLPRDYQKVIRRHDLEGASITEVAVEMSRSPGAISMIKVRAHEALRELLGGSSNFFYRGA